MYPRFPCVWMLLLATGQLIGQPSSSDLNTAKHVLEIAAKHEWKAMQNLAQSANDPMKRLFAGYLLFRSDPKKYGPTFTKSFPDTRSGISTFIGLNQSIPYSKEWQAGEYRHPKVKWGIGFDSIFWAYQERVVAGDPEALRRFLMLKGLGDGAYGEAISSGIAELFYDPGYVLAHWDLLEPHQAYLRSVKNWVSATQFLAIRNGFEERLNPSDPRLPLILSLLDNPE